MMASFGKSEFSVWLIRRNSRFRESDKGEGDNILNENDIPHHTR
jgi:hypothetical protein